MYLIALLPEVASSLHRVSYGSSKVCFSWIRKYLGLHFDWQYSWNFHTVWNDYNKRKFEKSQVFPWKLLLKLIELNLTICFLVNQIFANENSRIVITGHSFLWSSVCSPLTLKLVNRRDHRITPATKGYLSLESSLMGPETRTL